MIVMSDVKVSVIIPVYNTEDYIMKCLDSVLNQSLAEIEIIVVVDASPDNAIDIVRGYQKNDVRIHIINKEFNEGISAARNSGVAVSSGDYIIHLDSDDFWINNNMLRELYETAQIEDCDILRFNGYRYEEEKFKSKIFAELDIINGCFQEDNELWSYRSVFLFFFRKAFIDSNDLAFVDGICLGEDGIFVSSALAAAETVSSTSNCYYAYRINHSSMMNKKWTLEAFMEEEYSSQIIADNISNNRNALHKHFSYRINTYWLSKIAVKAKRELSKSERMKLYAFARNRHLRLQVDLLDESNQLNKRAKLLHEYFLLADYERVDSFIDDANCLTVTSVLSLGFLLLSLSSIKFNIFRCVTLFNTYKAAINRRISLLFSRLIYTGIDKDKIFENTELLEEYNFSLPSKKLISGASAMLRVKNEERRIRLCIESIIDLFDEIVVIDNGSDDATLEIVSSMMGLEEYAGKIKLFTYPHSVARCGPEHSSTSADSVRSLAYYYNWCLSKCMRSVVCKWDADMLLSSSSRSRSEFKCFLAGFMDGNGWKLGSIPIQTVYYDDENTPYISTGEINQEVRIFPNSSSVYFTKGALWEILSPVRYMPTMDLSEVCVYEIRDVADDEFSHWSTSKFKNLRKVREYRNYMRVKNNLHKYYISEFIPSEGL